MKKYFFLKKAKKYVKFDRPRGFFHSKDFFPSFYEFLKL